MHTEGYKETASPFLLGFYIYIYDLTFSLHPCHPIGSLLSMCPRLFPLACCYLNGRPKRPITRQSLINSQQDVGLAVLVALVIHNNTPFETSETLRLEVEPM